MAEFWNISEFVQTVLYRRASLALTLGGRVELRSVGQRIGNEHVCHVVSY